jgi:hypothetical protein
VPDLPSLLVPARPHQHLQAGGLQGYAEVDHPPVTTNQERPGAGRAANSQ